MTYGFGSESLRDFMFDLLERLQGSCSLKYLMNGLPRPYFSPSCDSNIAVPHSKKLGCQVTGVQKEAVPEPIRHSLNAG